MIFQSVIGSGDCFKLLTFEKRWAGLQVSSESGWSSKSIFEVFADQLVAHDVVQNSKNKTVKTLLKSIATII